MFNNLGRNRPRVIRAQAQTDRYAFVCEYYDDQAEFMRNYQLLYYVNDETIEMFDLKSKRIFLKRMKYPDLELDDLFVGNTVTIYSRQLRIIKYGDDFTAKKMAKYTQSTVAIIRPDGYDEAGKIIHAIETNGFRIKQLRQVSLNGQQASSLYDNPELIECMTSGPAIALELVGEDAIENWKKMITERPCLASSSPEDVERESDFYFGTQLPSTARFEDTSLLLIKPHAVTEGKVGGIIGSILAYSFNICAMETFTLDTTNAADFLEVYKGVLPEYQQMVTQYSSGPLVALELSRDEEGNKSADIVEDVRALAGPADPELCRLLRPNSLRAVHGTDKIKNAVHVTDLEEDAPLEVDFFFNIIRNA